MRNLKFKSACGVLTVLFCLGCLNNVNAEERSFLQRFANFFTPSGSVTGEGPIFDELRGVESQIDKVEVQYSRERRPGNKTRYRKQLDSLRNVRDSLITVIEKMPKSSAAVATSSSAKVAKSAASIVAQSSAGAAQSSSSVLPGAVSPSVVLSSSAAVPATVAIAASSSANVACVHDTVFVHDTLVVRDTVVIHDTLYVVLANKPKAPKEKKKGAEAPVK
jgi:hypothetical protein